MKKLCLIALMFVFMLGASAWAETFAQKLGWGATDKVVIFHIDDAGMSHSSNQGAIEATENGVGTSFSLMMPCGWVPEIASYIATHPNADCGVHLTLTAEWDAYRWCPLAGADVVPGLIDQQGCLWDNVGQVAGNATADEVDTEMRAQVARAERMGLPITHLDTHMGTVYARPDYFMKYVNLGIEKHIPVMVPGGHCTIATQEQGPELLELVTNSGAIDALWNAGLPVLDDLHTDSYGWSRQDKVANMTQVLRNLQPGITQIIVHSSRPTDEFPLITTSSDRRLGDLEMLLSPEIQQVINEEGIILTTWRELKERRDAIPEKQMPLAQAGGLAALGFGIVAAAMRLRSTKTN